MDKYSVLKQYFGHTAFREGQETLIDAVASGRDALGIMPTGGGKSLCYQIPALMLDGTALVISPLISLMADQVGALENAGISAVFVNSSLTPEQLDRAREGIRRGLYRLIYIAPERLDSDSFLRLVSGLRVSLIAVDEAHCVSQWGQDFRPSYLRIAGFVESLPERPPLCAFTATATERVRQDIREKLGLRGPVEAVTGFDRPNLFFDVRRPANKTQALLSLLGERRDKSGIVYCATRANVERVCIALQSAGVDATRYHAGLSEAERRQNQEDFRFDRKTVMVATNAFGMGIDKSNVGFVIHYNMPKDLESYYQEAGRAGRDGEPAEAILLYSPGDVATARFLITHGERESGSEEDRARREQDLRRLETMVGYCKHGGCLRGCILDYFGQEHGAGCGNCGNCCASYVESDITVTAQMILSCICRVHDKLGYYVGMTAIVSVLRGSRSRRIEELGLDAVSTYGLLRGRSAAEIRGYIEYLQSAGYLFVEREHSTLRMTERAGAVLFRGERVSMSVRQDTQQEGRAERRRHARAAADLLPQPEPDLLAALRALRAGLARREGVPAYIIFSNATLADMAAKSPRTRAELLEVSGVGKVKAERYGDVFLQAIEKYEQSK